MVIYDHEFETKANQGKIEPQHIHLVAYNIRVDRLLIDPHECRQCADSLHGLVPRTVRENLIQKRAIGSVLTNRITIVMFLLFSSGLLVLFIFSDFSLSFSSDYFRFCFLLLLLVFLVLDLLPPFSPLRSSINRKFPLLLILYLFLLSDY